MDVYLNRLQEKIGKQYSLAKKIFMRYFQFVSISCMTSIGFLCDIRIEGKIAGLMRGFYDEKNKTIAIPCLAVDNTNFRKYSPGIIMIQKCIEYIKEKHPEIQYLDLERGTEEYKFKMGGEPYQMECYSINLCE